MTNAERFEFLAKLHACNHVCLGHNENKASYMTAKQEIESHTAFYKGVPRETLLAMIEADSIWALQVYPETPVGFFVFHGPTLESVIDEAWEERERLLPGSSF